MIAVDAFLLAFPAFFSIVNPIGGAFIFNGIAAASGHAERVRVSRLIGIYALVIMLGALWFGVYVLKFFGITLGALRIAGGVAVAASAWELLSAPEQRHERKQMQAESDLPSLSDRAFFPLTMPFTTGPGTIAVAIALGAARQGSVRTVVPHLVGESAAAVATAATVWLLYRYAEWLDRVTTAAARNMIARLSAFLLLCIGVQILVAGIEQLVTEFTLRPQP